MCEENDYNLGYFEGVRNVLMAYIRMPDKDQFFQWLETEMADARRLRDDE